MKSGSPIAKTVPCSLLPWAYENKRPSPKTAWACLPSLQAERFYLIQNCRYLSIDKSFNFLDTILFMHVNDIQNQRHSLVERAIEEFIEK